MFDTAGLPFNYNEQLQQFYEENEVPEPDIKAVTFPKPSAPLPFESGKENQALMHLQKLVFSLPTYTIELTRFEKKIKALCNKIVALYQKGKMTQLEFDKKCLAFQESHSEFIDELESEDREAFPEYISEIAAIFGLSQHVF